MNGLLPFPIEDELAVRAQVRAACASIIPPEHLDTVVDLAMFAAQSALHAAERVLTSAGHEKTYVAALAPAVGLIAGRCQMVEEGLKAYAKLSGMASATSSVQIGGAAR